MTYDPFVGEPSSAEFRKWFEVELKYWIDVAGAIIAEGATHDPMILIIERGGGMKALPTPPLESTRDKDMLAKVHKTIGHHADVVAAVTVIETWVLMKPSSPQNDKLLKGSIANHPDRGEALMFNCISHGNQLVAFCKINRPANTLDPPTIVDPFGRDEHMEGRMVLDKPVKH